MNRRELVKTVALIPTLFASAAHPQIADEAEINVISDIPPLPADLQNDANQNPAPFTELEPVGTAKPTPDEVDAAYEILINSPIGVDPIDVAQYLLDIGLGKHGAHLRQFVREWPVRANPLIYHFFTATRTRPEGDTTAWCAAMLNWCLVRSRATAKDMIGSAPGSFSRSGTPFPAESLKRFSTNSASSGSFRCWQEENAARRGMIAVFKDHGTENMTAVCQGTGHVGFFLGVPNPGWIRVLGGNQTSPGSGGAVTVADFKTTPGSRFMKIVAPKA